MRIPRSDQCSHSKWFLLSAVFVTACAASEPAITDDLAPDGELFSYGNIDIDGKADGVVHPRDVWPQGNVTIVFDPATAAADTEYRSYLEALQETVHELTLTTPVRITVTDREPDGPFVRFSHTEGSTSWVDALGNDADELVLAERAVARHELGHLLGLTHTHQRVDRDDHIVVHWDAIKSSHRHNYERLSERQPHIGPYDMSSVMHYHDGMFLSEPCLAMTRSRLGHAPDDCVGPASRSRFDAIYMQTQYSEWDYRVISVLYCDEDYCGDNCAPAERCELPAVARHLVRARQWEVSSEAASLAERFPDAFPSVPLGAIDAHASSESDR